MTYLKLTSNLDASAVAALKPTLELLATGESNVCLDLSGVNHIDPSGVGALAFLYKRLRTRNRVLSVVSAHGQPLTLLRQLGLAAVLTPPLRRAA
jgi:anti-sigma B factor antagonist